jgi:hypothetical protein
MQSIHLLDHAAKTLNEENLIKPLYTKDDFNYIPPAMVMPILHHPKIIPLLEQGRVQGFGFDREDLYPDSNPYEELVRGDQNCTIAVATGEISSEDFFLVEKQKYGTCDLHLTPDEIEAIDATWDTVDRILTDTDLDPTSIKDSRS